ncbi:hypothetical protein BDB00DRAFT_822685 [Zychaea mexicana]|uniref:uncharacterized protein n=1 Tax=Zychaea mexicana TaxID=64656 RepID=UPI0022FDCA98|nr:uncharacterized protein BDB00DRAFT_822685 [Zychaea mexicana]KAI9493589.1 hypothetical protein BDB00DRAFT_822685 [Zychaea mexicana]
MTTQAVPLIIHHPPWATTNQQSQSSHHTDSATTVAGKSEETVIVVESNGDKVILPQETAIAMPEGQGHHSRCSSVVPPGLTGTEGGRERAALATVFGVQEYTESNTFWERLVQQHQEEAPVVKEEENKKAKKNASLADATSKNQQRPTTITTTTATNPSSSPSSKKHTISRKPLPQAPLPQLKVNSFKPLPDIPNVSKFNDFLIEDEHGMDLMFPASPSSVLLHSFSPPLDHTMTESSIHSSIILTSNMIEEEKANGANPIIQPPKLFIGYPPAIFDMLKSDDDERIIVWGPDPAYEETMVSSPTAMSSEESVSSSRQSNPSTPSIQGFSTNATAHTSSNSNINTSSGSSSSSSNNNNHHNSTSKRRSNLVSSARMSAQSLFTDGFSRLSRQKSLPTKMRPRVRHEESSSSSNASGSTRNTPRLLKRASFTMKQRVSDEELRSSLPPAPSTVAPQRVIEAASVEKLVEKLTNSLDYTLMTDFFLTYRAFISPTQLCKLLILRFRWALENDRDDRRVVRIRTFVVMRHWLLNYFVHDFIPCRELRVILTAFLNSLPQNTLVQQSPRDQRIVRGLKRVVRSLKTAHYSHSDSQQQQHPASSKPDLEFDKSTWVESSATQSLPMVDGLRNSVLYDDNGSLDSELSPGNSEAAPEDIEPHFANDADWSSEDQAMAKLQYERRRREEEEERQRADFFTSMMTTESDIPSLQHQQQDALSSVSDFMLNSPMSSIVVEKKQQAASKRPHLPSEYIAAMTAAAALKSHNNHQDNAAAKSKQYIPATIIHDMTTENIERRIRRIPSSKWCKASPEEDPAYNSSSKDPEQQQQQQGPPPLPPADGLARKLSRKSIERRRSEKNLREVASPGSSSNSSSVVSTPRLNFANSSSTVPELPPLPPATDIEAASAAAAVLSSKLNQQQQHQAQPQQSSGTPNKRLVMMMSAGKESFEALPYDTMASPPLEASPKQDEGAKRRLSKKLAKIFKQQQQQQQQQKPQQNEQSAFSPRNILKKQASFSNSMSHHPKTAEPPFVTQECSSKTEVVVIPAPALDSTSHTSNSSSSNVEVSTPTTPSSTGRLPSATATTTVGRIAAELRDDDQEDVPTVELRRCSSTIEKHTEGFFKRPARGPIYLSHLVGAQSLGFESDAAVHIQELDDGGSSSEEDSDDESDENDRVAPMKKGGLNRGVSLLSNVPKHIRTMSLIVEPDRLGELIAKEEEQQRQQQQQQQQQQDNGDTSSPTSTKSVAATSSVLPLPKPISPVAVVGRQKSFVLLYPASKLAQQLCLIERQVLFGVEWEELVDCRWRDGVAGSGGVQRLIQRFNAACQWVISEIVTTEQLHHRVDVIRRFIRLAQQCKKYANFATLLQILLGLQSPAVSRLHATWAQVGVADMRLLDQLSAFTSPMKNWKNIRDSMTKVAEEYGNGQQLVEQQQQHHYHQLQDNNTEQQGVAGGCIPFLGIYLSDLVFNSELPPYTEPVKSKKATCDSFVLQQPLVNFRKHRITATVIKRVLTFQNLARRYPYTPEPELFRLCLDIKSVDTDMIRKLSHEIDP